jgi:hypothetical protein
LDTITFFNQSAVALLAKAQRLFLGRDESDPFLGVRFDPEGPHLRFEPYGPGVWIELSPSTAFHPNQALHQIAHEVIHLLAPNRCPPTIMLEEGLAVWFSIFGPDFPDPGYKLLAMEHLYAENGPTNYRDALDLYNELLAVNLNAIVEFRTCYPNLASLTPKLICEVIPAIDAGLASRLCERRKMR